MNEVIIMKKSKNLSLSICALALILSGCGGGGSSTDTGMTGGTDTGMTGGTDTGMTGGTDTGMTGGTDTGMTGGTDTGMTGGTDTGMTGGTDTGMTGGTDTGMTGGTDTGMTGGTDTGMTGGNGTEPPVHTPTLAEVYSSDSAPDQPFSVVSASVRLNTTASTTSESDNMEVSVSLVRRNTGGGYDITYLIDGMERTVQFLPEHCDVVVVGECQVSGHYFWTMLATVGGQLDLTTLREYFSVGHLTTRAGSDIYQRQMFVFGVETPAAAVPTQGVAVYSDGYFRADAYRQNSSSSEFRQRYSGSMQIVANFDMSSLDGRIFSVRGSEPGSNYRVSWPTSSFNITNGQINSDGQFMATLTGMDSDPNVPLNKSVRGFVGEIVGRFFGPNAEELGGAVNASRDVTGTDDDRNLLYGYIAGGQLEPSKTLGSAGLLAGSRRDFTAMTAELQEDDGMATVERIANGWSVSVGGRTVELRDDLDYGSNPRFSRTYFRSLSDGVAYFWSQADGNWRNPEFSHFDVKGWAFDEQDPQEVLLDETYNYIVHGDRTPDSAMPTSGTATYDGRMEAVELSTDEAISSINSMGTFYWGDVTLTADFATPDVAGNFTNIQRSQPGRNGPYVQVPGDVTFDAGINGNGMTADNLTGTGDLAGYQDGNVRGAFFGPSAEEAAGVFDAHDQTGNKIKILSGWFGTTKDE